jgi:hypothetical protein
LAVDFARAINAADGPQAGPPREHGRTFRRGHHGHFARFAAVAILLDGFALPQSRVLLFERLRDGLL